jgi:formylglycine-generating enzyme
MRRSLLASAFLLAALFATSAQAATVRAAGTRTDRRPAPAPAGVVRIPSGSYRPLYGRSTDAPTRVRAFRLDRDPVTRAEFLTFLRAHPEWQRSRVGARLADRTTYLADWRGDLDAGEGAYLGPVTGISWFAARAYCAVQGKRLPTLDEWEYVAAASESARDAARQPRFVQRLVALYATRSSRVATTNGAAVNVYGVRGMHDLVWEWVDDFNASSPAHPTHVQHDTHDLSCAGAAVGAADASNYAAFLRYAVRAGATARSALSSMGFRCAA